MNQTRRLLALSSLQRAASPAARPRGEISQPRSALASSGLRFGKGHRRLIRAQAFGDAVEPGQLERLELDPMPRAAKALGRTAAARCERPSAPQAARGCHHRTAGCGGDNRTPWRRRRLSAAMEKQAWHAVARVPGHRTPCFRLLSLSRACALRAECQRVPMRSSEPDPLIEPESAVVATGLRHLEAGNRGAKVAPEGLRRAGAIAALLSAPSAPLLKKPGGLAGAAGSNDAALAHERPDRRTEILQVAHGIGGGCRITK